MPSQARPNYVSVVLLHGQVNRAVVAGLSRGWISGKTAALRFKTLLCLAMLESTRTVRQFCCLNAPVPYFVVLRHYTRHCYCCCCCFVTVRHYSCCCCTSDYLCESPHFG